MKPIGTPTNSTESVVQEADRIVRFGDRSEASLKQLQALQTEAEGEAKERIGQLIEAFLVDGGIQL